MERDKAWLMARVDIRANGCWEWKGAKNEKGYGRFRIEKDGKGTNIYTHRASYELFIGPIPDGLFVCHHCDNPPCINPVHLFVGTNSDNMKDCAQKGRHVVPLRDLGVTPPNQIISDEEAKEIRFWGDEGIIDREIARAYGISESTVADIRRNKTHKDESYQYRKKTRKIGGISEKAKKLTAEQVREIREKYAAGNMRQAQIAEEYGVTSVAISTIVTRKTWKHIA